jgi:glycosyltransferase involved in cell wall biosynthesis
LLVNWQDVENPHAGGAEIHLFELFSRLAAKGHQVHLVCSGWRGGASTATVEGIAVERHGDRHSFALLGRGGVRRALGRARFDVVVEDVNKLPLYTARLSALPSCVIVPHLFGSTAYHEVSAPMATIVVAAEKLIPWGYRRSAFHAISESTRDDLVGRGIARDRIAVIHPGVDINRFHPAAGLDRSAAVSFLYVGRLRRYKGVDLAIKALDRARVSRPDIRLDIAGTGDDRARLEALTRSLGLAGAVRFHGFVDETTKRSLLQAALANVLPSPKEGWGITVMEAAACGTPSIASDSPGLRDSVRDGETGVLVPHGDVEALARAMLQFAGNGELVNRLGRTARAHAERWSWDDAAAATERHLQGLIDPGIKTRGGG